MLLKLYIESHEGGEPLNKDFDVAGSMVPSSFFKLHEGRDNQNDSRSFTVTDLKIKYMNEHYFFFSENTWYSIQANDLLIFDQYRIRIDLIPENIPLPFETDHSVEGGNVNQLLVGYKGIPSYQDPLSFLYNTPAQKITATQTVPKGSSAQRDGDFAITFWDLIQKTESRETIGFSEKPLLEHKPTDIKENFETLKDIK